MDRILLIEDDAYIASLYIDVLSKNNYTVTKAADGQSGLKLINKGQFDLILLDLMLPDLNGEALLEAIKNKNIKTAPILLLTNVAQENVIEKCLSLGAKGYIPKADILPHDLILTVNEFLETGIFNLHKI